MENDLKDSIKARLYDFKYTPFLSAYLFSWIFFNSKLILIFTDSKLSTEKKIEILSWNQINYETPLFFALGYVFIFPIATALFYAVTLWYKALMNLIQQKIQDRTPLPQEKVNAIRDENIKLELEHRELIEKIEKIRFEYSSKEKTLISQFSEKEKTLNDEIESKKLSIEERINKAVKEKLKEKDNKLQEINLTILDRNNTIEEKQETINSLKTKISELEVQISELLPVTKEAPQIDKAYKKAKESEDKDLNKLTIDQIKILATFFNNDSTIEKNSFKNYVNSNYGLSKTLVDSKFKELSSLAEESNSKNYYVIKPQGTTIIEKLFT